MESSSERSLVPVINWRVIHLNKSRSRRGTPPLYLVNSFDFRTKGVRFGQRLQLELPALRKGGHNYR
jgi:hypothetical protein